MKRNLFSRYFSLCASIILTSIVLLGVMLVTLSAQYFKEENFDSLEKKAGQAARLVAANYMLHEGYIESPIVTTNFAILSAAAEADIFLTDGEGRTLICLDSESCTHKNNIIDKTIMEAARSGGYRGVTRLNGIYSGATYVVGVPVVVEVVDLNGRSDENAELKMIGVVFAGASASGMSRFLKDVFRIFLIGAVLVIAVSFIVIYFTTEAMVRPLRAMLKATDSFAKGDFTVRVPVEGDEEIEQLAMAFNNMASSLATLESTRRSFIANVSHELKTPMTTIGGFIDGILDGTIPQEKYPHYLCIVSNEVKRLSRMVVSMLNISRIEAGEMQLRPQTVDVQEIILRTILGFEQVLEQKHIDVIGLDAEKVFAEADPDLVHQITYNLIENAVKFTPDYGALSVEYKNEGKMLHIAIRNTGQGIPKEEIPRLFDRFYKSDRSRGIDTKGVGLGLHIVKSLVHLQGGTITVRSVEGQYTEFAFTLPTAQKPGQSLFRKSEKTK
ncbi:sensor histidine kinase [Oscillospiraceae bacterium LTW-04]|nr:HAMP domain-containing sensor histidine kinase [Oscillospiraceae bacterium MB24-C1]